MSRWILPKQRLIQQQHILRIMKLSSMCSNSFLAVDSMMMLIVLSYHILIVVVLLIDLVHYCVVVQSCYLCMIGVWNCVYRVFVLL